MAKKILTVAELEAKKSELEDQIADIEDQIEEAMKREQKNRYAKIKSDKKDLLKLAKETFENLDKIDDKWGYKGGVTFIVISLIIDISLLVWMHILL